MSQANVGRSEISFFLYFCRIDFSQCMETRMLHVSKEQTTANVVCFHSHTRDKRPISVPEEVRPTSTGVRQPITTTVTENGVFALVNIKSLFTV